MELHCTRFGERGRIWVNERSSVGQGNNGWKERADEVCYMQRRAAQRQSRIVTVGPLVLFSTVTAGCLVATRPNPA
jgi:hypothetical protein